MRQAFSLALCAFVALAASASAADDPTRAEIQTTVLITKTPAGGVPNGPSRSPRLSQDLRVNEFLAFESDATDLVSGDTNAKTDVFVIQRKGGWDKDANQVWEPTPAKLISKGIGGEPANGRSYGPWIDGKPDGGDGADDPNGRVAPRCVVFISEASNLVKGDRNRKADAFLHDMTTGKTELVSRNSAGKQSNGTTFDVTVDGSCDRVAFTSNATNLALTKTKKKGLKGAVTTKPKKKTRQVYVRYVSKGLAELKPLRGVTYLASASDSGKTGNGDSYEVSLSPRNRDAVAFTSEATNLDGADSDSQPDVFVSEDKRATPGFNITTRLASEGSNGASSQPSVSENGEYVTYASTATNLGSGDANGAQSDAIRTQIVDLETLKAVPVTHTNVTAGANGPSTRPRTSIGGRYITFETLATEFATPRGGSPQDTNGVSDVYLFTDVRSLMLLESRRPKGELLTGGPSTDIFPSIKGNYLAFVSAARDADPAAAQGGAMPQIFIRYLGGR